MSRAILLPTRTQAPPRFTPPALRQRMLWSVGGLVLLGAIGLAVVVGSVPIPLPMVLELLWAKLTGSAIAHPELATILFELRLPRVVLMALVGAALAASGTTYQGLFRNPLADPYLVGVAAGAGLGATVAFTLGWPISTVGLLAVPLAAFLGALLTVTLVILIAQTGATDHRTTPVATMLLAGVAIGAFASALSTLLMLRSPEGLRRAFYWLLGGYSSAGWQPVGLVLPYLFVGLGIVQLHARALNVLQLGEDEARQLGLNVERLKLTLVGAATLMTAAAVAFGGLIGFVGLIVPHTLRLLSGPDHRRLLPLTALGGAAFLVLADLVARSIYAPQELPVGLVTALCGAPFFIFLLRRAQK